MQRACLRERCCVIVAARWRSLESAGADYPEMIYVSKADSCAIWRTLRKRGADTIEQFVPLCRQTCQAGVSRRLSLEAKLAMLDNCLWVALAPIGSRPLQDAR